MLAKAPASHEPNSGKIVSAAGCRRFCALPNYEYFVQRMESQRGWKLAFAYSEYVSACRDAGERPYAYSTFSLGLREWRREMAAREVPEWYPGEYVKTYWSKGSAIVAGEKVGFPMFVAVMAFSDATFACRAVGMSTLSWMSCCQRAFKWLGGVPYVTDCQQCKVSVTAHSTLEAFARHYRTVLYVAGWLVALLAAPPNSSVHITTVLHSPKKYRK